MNFTFIIPLYNGQSFITNCIESIYKQQLQLEQFEIIVIDDGSTDDSLSIVNDLKQVHANLLILQQENAGVCVARNQGLHKARGEWIVFVDQDDELPENCYCDFNVFLQEKCEIDIVKVICGIRTLDNKLKYRKIVNYKYNEVVLDGVSFFYHCRLNPIDYAGSDSPWAYVYRNSFLKENNLLFLAGMIYLDDAEFLIRCFTLAQKCIYYLKPAYVQNKNIFSVTHSDIIISQKAIDGFILASKNLYQFKNSLFLTHSQYDLVESGQIRFLIQPIEACVYNKRIDFKKFKTYEFKYKINNLKLLEFSSRKTFKIKIYKFSRFIFLVYWFVNQIFKSVGLRLNLILK